MKAIIAILLVLACSGGQTGDVPAAPPTTITIASWNIQVFGPAKLADPARMDIIVKTLKRYDITAIQEVREAGQTLAPTLIGSMNAAEMFKPPDLATMEIQYIKDKGHGPVAGGGRGVR